MSRDPQGHRSVAGAGDRAFRLRLAGIALWHTAKVAQVRDLAEQMLRGDIPPLEDPQQELSRWIAERLLCPAELAIY